MEIVLDVENTTIKRNGKVILDPFEPSNFLVQVGMMAVRGGSECIVTLDHVEQKDTSGAGRNEIQKVLDKTTLLIMHNAQHDLMWLWECGFKYDGDIYDTMLAEYLLLRGQKQPLSLEACAQRYELEVQKEDTLKTYFKEGYNTNEIPLKELSHYLSADLGATRGLYLKQEDCYEDDSCQTLHKVRAITFRTCQTLTRMYMSGVRVDLRTLQEVRTEFEKEKADTEQRLQKQVRDLMGDTPININSPEQASQVLFSCKVNNKKEWADLFEFVNTPQEFHATVKANSSRLYLKLKAFTCPTCKGEAKTYKLKEGWYKVR